MDFDLGTLVAQTIIALLASLFGIAPVVRSNRKQKKKVETQETLNLGHTKSIKALGLQIQDLTTINGDLQGKVQDQDNNIEANKARIAGLIAQNHAANQTISALELRAELREEEAKKIPLLEKRVMELEVKLDIATASIKEKDELLASNAEIILELKTENVSVKAVANALEKQFSLMVKELGAGSHNLPAGELKADPQVKERYKPVGEKS